MTKTDIANMALSKIGESLITDIADTTSKAARLANLHYLPSLKEILRAHFWSFAMVVAEAEPLDAPAPSSVDLTGWTAAFPLPADFVKLRRITNPEGTVIDRFDFRTIAGARTIVSGGYESIRVDYVQLQDAPTLYDALFVEALVTLLASKLARAITGSERMEADLRQLYEGNALPAARTADGQDTQSNENHPMSEFLAGSLLGVRGDFFSDQLEA